MGLQHSNFSRPKIKNRKLRILLCGPSSDSHTWNLVFLQLLIEHMGHEVINLGACVPDENIINASRDFHVDALIVSTVNGHGHIDGQRLIRKIRKDDRLSTLPCVIGGKLGTQGSENNQFITGLRSDGFDAVYDDASDIGKLQSFVNGILENSNPAQQVENCVGF